MSSKGNFVSEWFGHRIYPEVTHGAEALFDRERKRCPFLSRATSTDRECVKAASSLGVCTISCASNEVRQDWLVCPYRALTDSLLADVVSSLFGERFREASIIPAPALANDAVRSDVLQALASGYDVVVYLQDKLGGEISISKTERSPEVSFDVTLVQLRQHGELVDVASYGILEVQTMDFHGSYRSAVKNLKDALRLHKESFPAALEQNPQWAGERIEGPNIANVFKRTFYQLMLKFQIGHQSDCRGCVLALPQSVWDSWQRHLGKPDLEASQDGTFQLREPGRALPDRPPAWIFVFDLERVPGVTPDPISVKKRIATDADSVAHFALKVAPEAAVGQTGSVNLVPERIRHRLSRFWPDIWVDRSTKTRRDFDG